jgi:hypothetical protein
MFLSCATHTKVKPNLSIENQLNSLKYKLDLPENWVPYLDLHNEISYKPKKYPGKYPSVQIHISVISPSNQKSLILAEFVDKRSQNIRFVNDYSRTKKGITSRFGDAYIIDEAFNLNNKKSLTRSIYFEYKTEIYRFSYHSNPTLFYSYIVDFESIFKNLEFKE